MILRKAQNIFMPKNIDLITIIIPLEGIDKIKAKKRRKNILNNHASQCACGLKANCTTAFDKVIIICRLSFSDKNAQS